MANARFNDSEHDGAHVREQQEAVGRMPGAMYLRARERHEREATSAGVGVLPASPATCQPKPPSAPLVRPAPRTARDARRRRHGRALAAATVGVTLAMAGAWTLAGRVAQPDTQRQPVVATAGVPAARATAAPSPAPSPLPTAPLPAAARPAAGSGAAAGAGTGAAAVSPAATASPSPAPARSLAGPQLAITTTPGGAHVTVRDIGWGTTPVSIRHLPAGPARVRVTLDGYRSQERQLMLREDGSGTLRLHVSLVPAAQRP